jgi:hypothetical protein
MEPQASNAAAMSTTPNNGGDVISVLADVLDRLARIELALASLQGNSKRVELSRRREIEQRRGFTPREVSRMLRCQQDSVRTMIRSGKLGAINIRQVKCGKPKFIVMPEHLAAFVEANKVYVPPKIERRRRVVEFNYYPDTWEEYERIVDKFPSRAQEVRRPDNRKYGPRGPTASEPGYDPDFRHNNRGGRQKPSQRAQFCPKTWEEYDAMIRRHPGLRLFIARPDGKRDGPRGPVIS